MNRLDIWAARLYIRDFSAARGCDFDSWVFDWAKKEWYAHKRLGAKTNIRQEVARREINRRMTFYRSLIEFGGKKYNEEPWLAEMNAAAGNRKALRWKKKVK